MLLNQSMSLVVEAHLIPFGVSRNDKPTNGVALCPNHHRAMDRYLIVPCPDSKRPAGVWRVNVERARRPDRGTARSGGAGGYTGAEKESRKAVEQAKASVRAFVEHPFHIVKNLFRHRKVRYRALAKNGHQPYTLFGLANVVIGARRTTV